MIDRRSFLMSQVGLFSATLRLAKEQLICTFGAIRWDAQYSDRPGEPGYFEEKSLSPHEWHSRAPLHSEIYGQDQIRFKASQQTFDAEIKAAYYGGLKYWAYLCYGNPNTGVIDLNEPMMQGLAMHKASAIRSMMKYSLIVTTNTLGRSESFDEAVSSIYYCFLEQNYLKSAGNRPVLFLFYLERQLKGYWNGSLKNLKAAVDALRRRAQQGGLGNPYIVLLLSPPERASEVAEGIGADAISAYAIAKVGHDKTAFSEFNSSVQAYWNQELQAYSKGVVPTVMVGWDPRPRANHPPPGNTQFNNYNGNAPQLVLTPTSAEFEAECKAAWRFIDEHPIACVSRLVLIYAWNENSEGGQLEPTLGDPTGKYLSTLGKLLGHKRGL